MGGSAGSLEDGGVAERLGTDIRYVNPPYIGPPLPTFDDGSSMNLWGIRRRPMANEYGEYAEPRRTRPTRRGRRSKRPSSSPGPAPTGSTTPPCRPCAPRIPTWPSPPAASHVQDFINGVAFGRGVEQVLFDIASEDPVYLYIVERRHRFYMAYIERILAAAAGRIDLVLCGDDFGSQRGLLISPASFDKLFAAKKKELFDLVHAHGAKVSHHCCGSSRALDPAIHQLRHGRAANDPAAGRRHESLRVEDGSSPAKSPCTARSTCKAGCSGRRRRKSRPR